MALSAASPLGVFDILVGFVAGDGSARAISRTSGLAQIGPRMAAGSVTREQLFQIAAQPAVRYLKLSEKLTEAARLKG